MSTDLAHLLDQALADEGVDVPRRHVEQVASRLGELLDEDRERRQVAWRARSIEDLRMRDGR